MIHNELFRYYCPAVAGDPHPVWASDAAFAEAIEGDCADMCSFCCAAARVEIRRLRRAV